jgi:hypothetical protein
MADTAQTHLSSGTVQGLDYVVLGVASCFQRDEDGRLREVLVAEPVPAAALDCLAQERRSTSYCLLYATTYAEVVDKGSRLCPPMFSRQGWCWEKILWSGYKRRPVRTAASPNFVTSLCTRSARQRGGCSSSISALSRGGFSMRQWK